MSSATGPEFDGKVFTPDKKLIRRYEDIPSIRSLGQLPEVEDIVPALQIKRNSVCLWTGPDGSGKTFAAEKMIVSVAKGDDFLGMPCLKTPTLYLDYENPAHTIKERFDFLLDDEEDPPWLKVWACWSEQQPPRHGSDLLIEIVRDVKPLIIIDTLRAFHDQKENESDGMACVMTYLRALAQYGATVMLLHHPSKAEGSNGRGSSVIHAACDLALVHSLDQESSVITLRIEKNRNGGNRTLTVRADFRRLSLK